MGKTAKESGFVTETEQSAAPPVDKGILLAELFSEYLGTDQCKAVDMKTGDKAVLYYDLVCYIYRTYKLIPTPW
jgi:hypothetical protein